MEPKKIVQELLREGLASSWDEAVHILYDAGEIDSYTHADLLSPAEYQRIYGDSEAKPKFPVIHIIPRPIHRRNRDF